MKNITKEMVSVRQDLGLETGSNDRRGYFENYYLTDYIRKYGMSPKEGLVVTDIDYAVSSDSGLLYGDGHGSQPFTFSKYKGVPYLFHLEWKLYGSVPSYSQRRIGSDMKARFFATDFDGVYLGYFCLIFEQCSFCTGEVYLSYIDTSDELRKLKVLSEAEFRSIINFDEDSIIFRSLVNRANCERMNSMKELRKKIENISLV